jgi:hypothetical protein
MTAVELFVNLQALTKNINKASTCSQSISNYTLYDRKKQGYIVKNPC